MTWGSRRIVLTLLAATVVQLHAIAGRAQSTTADGIEAFVRGDYPRAAEILKPIAERWPGEVDDAALFFMGAMYGNGLGLPQNIERSCALYERSGGAIQPGMFARLNMAIFQGLHPTLTVDQAANCQMLATIGFDDRFEPATFTLEPGHWITLDLSSRTQSVSAIWPDDHSDRVKAKQSVAVRETKCATVHRLTVRSNTIPEMSENLAGASTRSAVAGAFTLTTTGSVFAASRALG
jgi:hypothetical protein